MIGKHAFTSTPVHCPDDCNNADKTPNPAAVIPNYDYAFYQLIHSRGGVVHRRAPALYWPPEYGIPLSRSLTLEGDIMKTVAMVALLLALPVATAPAAAKGCIKGAIAGGIAGHYAGHHAIAGAMAGCVAGHYIAKHHDKVVATQHTTTTTVAAPAR